MSRSEKSMLAAGPSVVFTERRLVGDNECRWCWSFITLSRARTLRCTSRQSKVREREREGEILQNICSDSVPPTDQSDDET